ncbi:hypothetical protein [Sporosarcina sp. FSL W7-1283]|uniref:hypothetical protein n=1 Tax=Sporosarcina sp. FSL W7-1283 TaxID=2921560 RepID=UPI0030F8BA6F
MDHVIEDMKEWKRAFEHDNDGHRDEDTLHCIKKAIDELEKYYTHHDNERL